MLLLCIKQIEYRRSIDPGDFIHVEDLHINMYKYANPHNSISYLWFSYSLKYICNHPNQHLRCFFGRLWTYACAKQQKELESSSVHFPAEAEQDNNSAFLPELIILSTRPFHGVCSTTFFYFFFFFLHFCVFFWWFHCWRLPQAYAEVPSSVPKGLKAGTCLPEKIHVLDKLHWGLSVRAVGVAETQPLYPGTS